MEPQPEVQGLHRPAPAGQADGSQEVVQQAELGKPILRGEIQAPLRFL